MQHQKNRRLLEQLLAHDYYIMSENDLNDSIQLIILDSAGLTQCRQKIHQLKHEIDPLFLPVLLITNDTHLIAKVPNLWDVVDDLIASPVDPIVLQTRLKVLLRTRKLSEKNFDQTQSLKYLQRAIESASDSILLINNDAVLYVNPAAEKLFNVTLHKVGSQYLNCIDTEEMLLHSAIKNAGQKSWQGELTLCNHEKQPFPAWVRIDPMSSENDIESGLVITITDMRQQQQIQNSEREQRLIAEVLQDTAIILTSTLDLQEVFERILTNIKRVIPQQATAIFLIENGYASVAQSQGFTKKALQRKIDLFDRIPIYSLTYFQMMIETQETIYLSNLSELELPHLATSNSIIISPILLKQDIIGFIMIEQKIVQNNGQRFAGRLTAFAAQAAIAIQNSRLYARAQGAAVFEERQRLARDFHDSVSQTLFSASFIVEAIRRNETNISDDSASLLDELYLLIRGALAEMRTLLLELKPTKLLETDMTDLLRQSAEALWSRKQIELDIDIEEQQEELPLRVKVAFYRIAREALHNIVKHSQAETVALYYRGTSDNAILKISDNGIGFVADDKKLQQGLGLSNMKNRAKHIGANLKLETAQASGTTIHLLWDELDVKK